MEYVKGIKSQTSNYIINHEDTIYSVWDKVNTIVLILYGDR